MSKKQLRKILREPQWHRNDFGDHELLGKVLLADPPELFALCEKANNGRWSVGLFNPWGPEPMTVIGDTAPHFKTLKQAKLYAEQSVIDLDERLSVKEERERQRQEAMR